MSGHVIKPATTFSVTTTGGNNITLDASSGSGKVVFSGKVNQQRTITTVSSTPYTVTSAHDFLSVDTSTARELDLPAVTDGEMRVTIADGTGSASTNNITIDPNGSDQIKGQATLVINGDYDTVELYSPGTGTQWYVLSTG